MRSTRKQPFCWQEKKILRLLRKKYTGMELVKMRALYGAITEIDSDFNGQDIRYYTKTIHTYSGLSMDWIPKGLKILEDMGMIQLILERENGKWKGKKLNFTPENIKEMPSKTVPGSKLNGQTEPSEDSSLLEDSSSKPNNKKTDEKELTTGAKTNVIIKKYCELHKQFSGKNPNIDGKTIGLIKNLIKRHKLEFIQKNLEKYYGFDFWFTKNGGRSFTVFYNRFDEIVTARGDPIQNNQKKEIDPEQAYKDYMKGK